jgi:hypothetical protein
MKINLFFFLAAVSVFLQSCATAPTPTISAEATMGQKVGHGNTIVSMKKHFVSFTPYTRLDAAVSNIGLGQDKTKFMMTVENCGSEPIEFSPREITVMFVPSADGDGMKSVGVQSWQDFVDQMDEEYDRNERQYLYDTLYGLYMESEVGIEITDKLSDLVFDIEQMREQNDVLQEMLPAVVVKPQRILPGKSYSGVLICNTADLDASMEGRFRITVAMDGEAHGFIFNRTLPE